MTMCFQPSLLDHAVPDRAVSDHAVSDHAVSDRAVSDRAVSDRAVSDRAVSDRAVSDRAVSDRAVSDRAVSDRAVSDRAVSDRAVSDRAVSDRAVSDRAVPDQAPGRLPPAAADGGFDGLVRTTLPPGAWIDVLTGWQPAADELFSRLVTAVPWQAERRPMYDRMVDVPRLVRFYATSEPLPDPALDRSKALLDARYAGGGQTPEPFVTAGLCLYRDGHDSVAWHGDRIGRGNTHDTVVAILSLGAPRALLLRPLHTEPRPGSPGAGSERPEAAARRTIRLELGHGDLLVMGGSCQRTWEHAVPKTARPVGPRISVQFRTHGVR